MTRTPGFRSLRRGFSGGVALALLLALSLAACTPADGPPPVAVAAATAQLVAAGPPQLAADHLVADDGAVLPLRRWLPKGEVKAVILALHGFNDYSHAFEMPAKLWAERGIATYAYDQRGFGRAPLRLYWPGRAQLAADAATAARLLRATYPGKPLYLLGESMGGAVAIVAATGETGATPPDVDGLILSAPAVWGRPAMDFIPKLALFAGVRLTPSMTVTGNGLHITASDNLPMLRELSRDPVVIKETRVDTIYGLVNLMDAALEAAPRLEGRPVLVMYGAKDEIVPPEALRRFVGDLPPDPDHCRRLAYYGQGYHMLLRDLDRSVVAGDVASWVLDRRIPLPSQADRAELARPWPPTAETAAPHTGQTLAPPARSG